jgi:hypothetical protein
MIKLENRFNPIFVSFTLSIILHLTFFLGISLFKSFQFLKPDFYRIITITLHEDVLSKQKLTDKMIFSPPKVISEKEAELPVKQSQNIEQTKAYEEELIVKESISDEQTPVEEKPISDTNAKDESKEIPGETREAKIATDNIIPKEYILTPGYIPGKEPLQIVKASRERFQYDIYWLGIYVGTAVLEAVNNEGVLRITSQVDSSPFISAFYKVEDRAESVVLDGTPVNFRIKQREGRYKSDKETIFDMYSRTITFFNYLEGTETEHNVKEAIAWDVVSGFYYLRTQPLEVGKPVFIDVFDSNKFYKAKVDVLRKEKIEISDKDELNTIVVRPALKSEGLFQRQGEILIWLTDDENKIPVKVETTVFIGSVVAKLRGVEIE